MILTEKEYKIFLKTHIALLFYIGQQSNIISEDITIDEFINLDLSIKFNCRNILLKNKKLLDDYLLVKADHLTEEQITILKGFKKSISREFIIFKCLAKNAIFVDISNIKCVKFYAVKALVSPFYDFYNYFPVLVEATILPFNNQIIYDGFIESQEIYFGSGMRSTLREDYKKAKKNKQIITVL